MHILKHGHVLSLVDFSSNQTEGAKVTAQCRFLTLLLTTQRPVVCVARLRFSLPTFLDRRMPLWRRGYVCTTSMYSSRVPSVLPARFANITSEFSILHRITMTNWRSNFQLRVSVKFNCRCEFARFYLESPCSSLLLPNVYCDVNSASSSSLLTSTEYVTSVTLVLCFAPFSQQIVIPHSHPATLLANLFFDRSLHSLR